MHARIDRILKESGAVYKVHNHAAFPVPIRSPRDFANALGYDEARITKTLFLQVPDANFGLAVLSSHRRARLDLVASCLQARRVQFASMEDLKSKLDYPPTSVSPLGGLDFPVVFDAALLEYETILIGSGVVSTEIEIAPELLQRLTNAMIARLTNS